MFSRAMVLSFAVLLALTSLIVGSPERAEATSPYPVQISHFAQGGFANGKHWIVRITRVNTGFEKFVDVGKACPQNNHEAAGLIGGEFNRWSKPDSRFKNWVYNDPGNFAKMTMTFFGVLDGWWDGAARSTNTQGETHNLDRATFKCDA